MLNPEGTGKTVSLTTREGVSAILLQNPPLNIMTMEMMQEVTEALRRVELGPSKVVLIRGAGKCFSAGADIREHLPEHMEALVRTLHELFTALLALKIPSVAAMHGAALGGGFELGTLCDLTLASSQCKLGVPEIRLGVFPPLAAALYPRWIGYKAALDLLCTGRDITAEEAKRIGLINETFPEENFPEHVQSYVNAFASLSRPALISCKKAVRMGLELAFPQSLREIELVYLRETMATEDASEGLRSFMEKRKPVWKDK